MRGKEVVARIGYIPILIETIGKGGALGEGGSVVQQG